METVATFEKVSFEEYKRAAGQYADEEMLRREWEGIKLPVRSTSDAAGYDFYTPHQFHCNDRETALIATGIRCKINEGWFLMLVPRSGLGFKTGMRLENTAGIIDADYYRSDNEGHIMAKVRANSDVIVNSGDRFMQGILLPFGIATNGNTENVRTGGFGSSGA